MNESAFIAALAGRNTGRPPVWFMRQAGRYHAHYQSLKRHFDFMQLCKQPELAAETAMGPVHDFNFDAAILFSDLLFPLEVLGMGLTYDPGPKLAWRVKTKQDLAKLTGGAERAAGLAFQSQALTLTRRRLRGDKGLIGFVGGPFTLYVYAVAGSHEAAKDAIPGLESGLFAGFNDKLLDLLAANMAAQAGAGADCVALFDTAAGELTPEQYARHVVPAMRTLFAKFRALAPDTPVIYYSRGTGPEHWDALAGLPIACLGVDWRHDISDVLKRYRDRYAIQGNVDPDWMLLPASELEPRLRAWFAPLVKLEPHLRARWICGLGHGVLQKTPEANVRLFMRLQREIFG
ncbi:MAG: uroporphyrinogen decarboxylase family protein [Steroidobacteraceae bacterium]